MLRNPEVEAFFLPLSAHSDLEAEFVAALAKCGDYQLRHAPGRAYGAVYAVTHDLVFCGAAGMGATYWRLAPRDVAIALATGAVPSALGEDWVEVELFRSDWPVPDLKHWALRAYGFARAPPPAR